MPTSSLLTTPLFSTDDLAQEDLLQKYQERVDKLSHQNRVTKFCTDAGFLTTVDVGQYFMTKDIEEFSQFTESVVCREFHRFWLPAARATFPHLPDSRPSRAKKAMISMVGLLALMEELIPQVNFSWVGCCRSLASWKNIYHSRIMYLMQSFFSQQLIIALQPRSLRGIISNYSYSRGRCTELFSNSCYSRGRCTERPQVTITIDNI